MKTIILITTLILSGCAPLPTRDQMFPDLECRHEMDKAYAAAPNTIAIAFQSNQFYKDCVTLKKHK